MKSAPPTAPGTVVPGLVMIQATPIAPLRPQTQPAAAPSGDGGGVPGGDDGLPDPVDALPDAGSLLPPLALPSPVTPPGIDVAGPGAAAEPVAMVGGVLDGLPPLPGLPGLPELP